jgi:hypothetical protein
MCYYDVQHNKNVRHHCHKLLISLDALLKRHIPNRILPCSQGIIRNVCVTVPKLVIKVYTELKLHAVYTLQLHRSVWYPPIGSVVTVW